MFKLTRKLEYALIALRYLQKKGNICSTAGEISDFYLIPREILAKTLQKMVKLKYIKAYRGPNGGYLINKSLNHISLTKFIEDMEGFIGMVDCSVSTTCIQFDNCNIRVLINKINDNIKSIFNHIPISDITN